MKFVLKTAYEHLQLVKGKRQCITNSRIKLILKKYLKSRILYTTKGPASYNPEIFILRLSGDVHPQPGPISTTASTKAKSKANSDAVIKSTCFKCYRTLAKNHRSAKCIECMHEFHMKCTGLTPSHFKKLPLKTLQTNFMCPQCTDSQLPFNKISDHSMLLLLSDQEAEYELFNSSMIEIKDLQHDPLQELLCIKQEHHNQGLLIHLNNNSLQNKFEGLKLINDKLKASIIVLTETKIDSTYPDDQFRLLNYRIFRNDRRKGGGGVLAYVSDKLPVKRLKLPQTFKKVET